MLIIPGNIRHNIRPFSKGDLILYTVHFTAELYGIRDFISILRLGGKYKPENGLDLLGVSRNLAREFTIQPPGWQGMAASEITSFIIKLARSYAEPNDICHTKLCTDNDRILPAIRLINNYFADPFLRIKNLAESCNLSITHFRRIFKKVTGASPVDYIRCKRIDIARQMLKCSNNEIKKIAHDCGFNEVTFFYRVFKKITGQTPAEYRDKPLI